MKDFKELTVWKKSHDYVLEIYKTTHTFPKEEMYGLVSQIRRSAVSISANIAEGCGRNSDAELRRFLVIAYGSASENDYLLFLSKELNYIDSDSYKVIYEKLNGIRRMLNSFIQKLNKRR